MKHFSYITEMREAFSLFDKNGDGHITKDELCCVMTSLRHQATEEDILEMIHHVDIDGKRLFIVSHWNP